MTEPITLPANATPRLNAALAKLQAALPKLERDRTVTVEPKDPKKDPYSYSYATLGNLSDVAMPLMGKFGLAFSAMPGLGSDGKFCLRYSLLHESGEERSGEFPLSGEGGIQMIGGRITYARRYCLQAVTGLVAEEDDESQLAEDGAPRTAQRAARTTQATRSRATAAPADEDKPATAEPARTAQRARAAAPPVEGRTTAQRARARSAPPPLPGEDDAGENTPPVIDDKMRATIFALWNELGFGGDKNREQRLKITRGILRLPELESTSDLTPAEGKTLIDALKAKRDEKDATESERRAAEDGAIYNQHEPARR